MAQRQKAQYHNRSINHSVSEFTPSYEAEQKSDRVESGEHIKNDTSVAPECVAQACNGRAKSNIAEKTRREQ